jgi:hypothetical protein
MKYYVVGNCSFVDAVDALHSEIILSKRSCFIQHEGWGIGAALTLDNTDMLRRLDGSKLQLHGLDLLHISDWSIYYPSVFNRFFSDALSRCALDRGLKMSRLRWVNNEYISFGYDGGLICEKADKLGKDDVMAADWGLWTMDLDVYTEITNGAKSN